MQWNTFGDDLVKQKTDELSESKRQSDRDIVKIFFFKTDYKIMSEKSKQLKVKLRGLRLQLDALSMLASAKADKTFSPNHIETSKKLLFAKAWIGKAMVNNNLVEPYKKADNPKDIPETADVYSGSQIVLPDIKNDLQLCNFIRGQLSGIEVILLEAEREVTGIAKHYIRKANDCVCEGRFFQGFELAVIRDELN